MHHFETIDLGPYRGAEHRLVGFVSPAPDPGETFDPDLDAEAYGVTLARSTPGPRVETVEVVRLDTAHGDPHVDRLFLPVDTNQARKRWLTGSWNYDRMRQHILENWQDYVDRYLVYRDGVDESTENGA